MLAQTFFKKEVARQEAEKAAVETPAVAAETPAAEIPADTVLTGEAQAAPAEAQTEATPAPETTEAEIAEEKAEEVLSPETQSLDPKLQDKINRRIGKEVAKRKELERQVNELKVQMLNNQQTAPQPQKPAIVPITGVPAPLANVEDVQGLVTLQQEAKEAVRFVDDQLERDDFPAEGLVMDGRIYRKDDLRAIRRNAKLTLEDHIPQRLDFLNKRQQSQQAAYGMFPFMKDKGTPEYLEAQQILATNPWLRSVPSAEFVAGAIVKGLRAVAAEEAVKKAKEKAANGGKPSPRPANSQTQVSADSTATRVPVTTQMTAELKAVSDKFKAKGSITGTELAQLLSARSKLRNTR